MNNFELKNANDKRKQTPNGLRLLMTFENVKSINKALEMISLV